jgi:hypothetical protein
MSISHKDSLKNVAKSLHLFLSGYFPIFPSYVEAGMSKMLLEQPQPITWVIVLHGVDSGDIPTAVRTHTSYLPCILINQVL